MRSFLEMAKANHNWYTVAQGTLLDILVLFGKKSGSAHGLWLMLELWLEIIFVGLNSFG